MAESEENSEEDKKSNNYKESLFRFGKLNKYYLFPFITPFIGVAGNCIIYFLNFPYKNNPDNQLTIYFIETFIMFLAHITGGLLYFISSIRSETEKTRYEAKNENEQGRKSLRLIYNKKIIKKNKLTISIIIFIISFIFTFPYIREIVYSNEFEFEERLYYLFFVPILSKIILKKGIFRHQLSSLFISFLGFIIFFIPFFIEIKNNDLKEILIANIFTLIEAIFHSLYLVLTKYLMHYYYLSPFLCILLIGVIGFVLSILGFIIVSIFKKNNIFYDAFILLKDMEIKYYILLLFIYIIICIYHIFIFLVIFYFSPILSCISDIVNPLFSMIFEALMDNDYKTIHLILKSFGYILILFAAFIYNEIIILNFCGCNEYTSICIKERGNEELHSIRNSESDAQSEENFIENEEEKVNE